ncbi:MAG: hypothetical protein V1789_10390 [PVC group bacterium]
MNGDLKKSALVSRWPAGLLLAGSVAGLSALAYSISSAAALAAALGLCGLLITAYCYLHFPHRLMMAFGCFAICQNLLQLNAARINPLYGRMIGHADEVFVLWIFLIFLVRQKLSGSAFARTKLGIPLLGFLLAGVCSGLLRHVPAWIMGVQAFLYLKGFVLFYVVLHLPVTPRVLRGYVRFFAFVGILVFALGIIDLVNPYWFRALTGNEINVGFRFGIPSTLSIFTHPGDFGWFMAFLALYGFAYYLTFNRAIYLVLGSLFTVGSFLSMRRRNLAGIFAGLVCGIWKQPKIEKVRAGFILGAVIVLFIVLTWSTIEMLYTDLVEGYVTARHPREEARNVLYVASFQIARAHFPLGVGLGRYGSWMSAFVYSPCYREYRMDQVYGLTPDRPYFATDTFWPAVLGETGVLGLLFYIWIIMRIFFSLNRRVKEDYDPYVRAFLLGTLLILLESLIESPASAVFAGGAEVYFIFGALGIAAAAARQNGKSRIITQP